MADANGNINCTNCVGCYDCTDCRHCTSCVNCKNCTSCTMMDNCSNCEGCDHMIDCHPNKSFLFTNGTRIVDYKTDEEVDIDIGSRFPSGYCSSNIYGVHNVIGGGRS